MTLDPTTLTLAYLLAAVVGYAGYRAHALTAGGAVAACVVGGTIFGFGGWAYALLLVFFFVSSSALSSVKSSDARKQRAAETFEKGGRRDAAQVLANGGVAAAIALLAPLATPLLFAVYAGALGTATADTWATEIGVLSRREPRLITTGRRVPVGTSGGITWLGTGATVAGALSLGLMAALLSSFCFWNIVDAGWAGDPFASLLAGTFGGIAGSLAESLLGATVQAAYLCPRCGLPTESRVHRCGTPTGLTRGLSFVNNDLVNLLATLVGAGVGGVVVWLG